MSEKPKIVQLSPSRTTNAGYMFDASLKDQWRWIIEDLKPLAERIIDALWLTLALNERQRNKICDRLRQREFQREARCRRAYEKLRDESEGEL